MKTFLAIVLVGASGVSARADYSYTGTTQLTSGPLTRGARETIVTTNLIKGNRMATVAKDRTTVINLDNETIVEIDIAKKQYSIMTFAQMKQAMEDAAAGTAANFTVSAKATGQTKAIGVLNAKELVLTMTMDAINKDNGKSDSMNITVDSWLATVPGYEEVKAFRRKLGEKLGYAFASGMSQIAMTQPQTLPGFAEAAKEMNKVEGVPVQSTMKMGGVGSDTTIPPQTQSNNRGIAGAALSRLGGFGRKKSNDQSASAADQQQSGIWVETTTELGSFSSGPVDASKFEVPAGFKKVDPTLPRPVR